MNGWFEVEADPFCRKVIKQRAKEGLVPDGPVFEDIRCLKMSQLKDQDLDPDGIFGGWPCQASIQSVFVSALFTNQAFFLSLTFPNRFSFPILGRESARLAICVGWTTAEVA